MEEYSKYSKKIMARFEAVEVEQVLRTENYRADILARMGATSNAKMPQLDPVETETWPSIVQEVEVMCLEDKASWMDPKIPYIRDGTLPTNKRQARNLRLQAAKYTLIDRVLYRRGYTQPLLRCLTNEQTDYVLREIHEGVCGNHFSARSLAYKALRQRYFWPMMHHDAQKKARNCKNCQNYTNISTQPPENLTSITSPWSFAQ